VDNLIYVAGLVLIFFAVAFLWELMRRGWYGTAAKIMGWDDREKFKRETARLKREAACAERQHEKDMQVDSGDRRRMGVTFVTIAASSLAVQMDIPWWTIALFAITTYVGLHRAQPSKLRLQVRALPRSPAKKKLPAYPGSSFILLAYRDSRCAPARRS